jgi:hypothetical protein
MARTIDREIVGRGEQLDRLRAFLAAPAELPAVLLLEGEAGIGKSTLWSHGVEEAGNAGYRVLVCRPSLAEAALSYAALGDLLDDALDDARDRLSEPQRRALAVALLLDDSDGPQPDQRAVGVGVLGVLRALTASGRVLVAIDDVQWVDGATAAALDFALRRLREEPVAVLGARRAGLDGGLELADAERLAVDGLSLGATHQLLRSRLATSFPRPVLVRLHDTSGGNPFYALELGRALVRRERVSDPGEPAPLPDDLAGLLRERLAQLTPEALTIAAAVAALAIPTIDATVSTSDGGRGALEEAIAAEVLELDGDRVRFTHPLLATGAYNELWPPTGGRCTRASRRSSATPRSAARHLAREILAASLERAGVREARITEAIQSDADRS